MNSARLQETVSIYKTATFLYGSNNQKMSSIYFQKTKTKTTPFTTAAKRTIHLGINVTKKSAKLVL